MIRATSAALFVFLCAATGVLLWLGWAAHGLIVHLDMAAYNASVAAYNANGAVSRANDTLAALNAPCTDFQGDWICGPIPQLSQTEKNIGILAAKSAQQVQQSAGLVNSASTAILGISQHVQGTADAATSMLVSGQRATDSLPPLVEDIRTAVQGIPPIEDEARRTLSHFDALVNSPDLSQALSHVNSMMSSGDGILADARKVADKETADWLKPRPWWQAPIAKGGQLIDITAAIARHAP